MSKRNMTNRLITTWWPNIYFEKSTEDLGEVKNVKQFVMFHCQYFQFYSISGLCLLSSSMGVDFSHDVKNYQFREKYTKTIFAIWLNASVFFYLFYLFFLFFFLFFFHICGKQQDKQMFDTHDRWPDCKTKLENFEKALTKAPMTTVTYMMMLWCLS